MICALTNSDIHNIDIPTVICGGTVKDSISKSAERIREINKSREITDIVTLLTKEEMFLYLVLKNVTEHKKNDLTILDHINSIEDFLANTKYLLNENFKVDSFNENILLNVMDNNYDSLPLEGIRYYKKELEKKLTFFFQCLSNFTKQHIRIAYDIELFKMFAPILEVVRFEIETGHDLSFFFKLENFEYNGLLVAKYPSLRKYIKIANNFNKTIDKYSGILINYLDNSFSKYVHDDILFITDNLSCFQSIFCDEQDCEEKLICLYDSIEQEKIINESDKYRYIVTNGEITQQKGNVFYVGKNSIFICEENICQIINF